MKRFIKYIILILVKSTLTAKDLMQIYLKEVVFKHEVSEEIVFD